MNSLAATHEPPAVGIRPYASEDEKQVRFMVGQALMEPLAFANKSSYFHPLTLAIWIAVSSMFAQYMNWWPNPEQYGFMGYFVVLPAFFAPAVPILALTDWLNRPSIEENTEKTLRRPDLYKIDQYYTRSPSSGLYLLTISDKIIGLIALDASKSSTSDCSIAPASAAPSATERKQMLESKGTANIATIRHFFVEEPYRPAKPEDDLLKLAVRRAFEGDKTVDRVRALGGRLRPTVEESLRRNGFVPGEKEGTLGFFKWETRWYTLTKEAWEATEKAKANGTS